MVHADRISVFAFSHLFHRHVFNIVHTPVIVNSLHITEILYMIFSRLLNWNHFLFTWSPETDADHPQGETHAYQWPF